MSGVSHQQHMQDKQHGWWSQAWDRPRRYKWWALVTVASLCVAVLVAYQQKQTLWDWPQLLVVPASLAGAGFWFSRQQTSRKSELAEDKLREGLLAECIEALSDLLLKGELRHTSNGQAQGQGPTIARALALATLRGLDPTRKGELVRFLYEAGLIMSKAPIIDLNGADLTKADLVAAHLHGIDLTGANLSGADLRWAELIAAHLSKADLTKADLTKVDLIAADLTEADLTGADLTGADLRWANLSGTNLSGTDLIETNLREANYSKQVHDDIRPTMWPTPDFDPDKVGAEVRDDAMD